MNQSDIEFTMGLDTSPAEQKLNQFQQRIRDSIIREMGGLNNQNISPNYNNALRNNANNGSILKGTESLNATSRQFENSAYKFSLAVEKLNLQLDRAEARRDFRLAKKTNDVPGMQDAAKRLDEAQAGLDNIRDLEKEAKAAKEEQLTQESITNETKEQSKEFNQHHIKLGKTLTILGLIKAAWEAIKKTVQAAFDKQLQLNKETGFLTMDPKGAFRANSDREYAMIMAGLSHMGKAAPFSIGAFDAALTDIQIQKERAMAGQGVDEAHAIAAQQLNDILGTKLNVQQLLTGDPSRSNTQILKEMLDAIETGLPKLASMDEKTQARMMSYIRTMVGPELANALMANYNLNLRTGENILTTDRVVGAGGSVSSNLNVAQATRKITTAGSDVANAFEKVRDKFLLLVSGPLTSILEKFARFLDVLSAIADNPKLILPNWASNIVDKASAAWEGMGPTEKKVVEMTGNILGNVAKGTAIVMNPATAAAYYIEQSAYNSLGTGIYSKYLAASGGVSAYNERINRLRRSGNISDQLTAALLSTNEARSDLSEKSFTEMRQDLIARTITEAANSDKLDDIIKNSKDPVIKKIAKLAKKEGVKSLKGIRGLIADNKDIRKAFEEGGSQYATEAIFDNVLGYLFGGINSGSVLDWFVLNKMTKEATGGATDIKNREINGTITTVVVINDAYGRELYRVESPTDISKFYEAVNNSTR